MNKGHLHGVYGMASRKRKSSRAVKLVREGIPRTMVPAPEVMKALERRRRAYHNMLDEICKAALGMGLPGRDGTPYEEARIDDGTKEPARRNVRSHAFDLMASKKQIKPNEWAAGTRFRDDWEMAQISPLKAASYDDLYDVRSGPGFSKPTPPKGLSHDKVKAWLDDQVRRTAQGWQPKAPKLNVIWRDLKPSVIDAHDRLKAVRRATGREGYAILEAICAEGRTIASLADTRRFGNRKTTAKKLRTALDELGRHYSMWTTSTGIRPTQSVEYA